MTANLYDRFLLPHLVALAMRNHVLRPFRHRIAQSAEGRVLEIGIGTGLNLPFYTDQVREVTGVDPSNALLEMARRRCSVMKGEVRLIQGSGENLPFEQASFDAVVMTWTLCSVGDPLATLHEARRVLRPGGQLLFVEHGLAPDPVVRKWQDRVTPVWRRIAGGCHLNRKADDLVRNAGFVLDDLRTGYLRGPKILTFMYEGRAKPF